MTSRGGGDRTLKITILGDTKDAERAVRELEISLGGVERGGGRAQAGMGLFVAGAVGAAAAAGTAALAIGRDLFDSFAQSERAGTKLDAVLKATGNTLNTTRDDILGYSTELQRATGVSDEAITDVQTLLLTFREVGPEAFRRATEAALDMSAVFGQDASASAVQLGKALQDPIAGVTALRRVGVQLSDEQEEQIQKFAEVNDIVGAQNIILGELEKQVGGTARAMGEDATGKADRLTMAIDDLKEAAGEGVAEGLAPLTEAAIQFAESDEALQHARDLSSAIADIAIFAGQATGKVIDLVGAVNGFNGAGQNGRSGFLSEMLQSMIGVNALEDADKIMTELLGSKWKGTDWQREQDRIAAGNPEVIDGVANVAGWTPDWVQTTRATSFGRGGSGGGGKQATAFGAGSLAAISGITGMLPGANAYGLTTADLEQFQRDEATYADIRRKVNRELAELGLVMADLDARGLELGDEFKTAEERANALRDSLKRVDLIEDLRLDPWRDVMKDLKKVTDEALEAEKALADQRKEEANRLASQFVSGGLVSGSAFGSAFGGALSGPVMSKAQIDAAIEAGNRATNARVERGIVDVGGRVNPDFKVNVSVDYAGGNGGLVLAGEP